MTPVILALALTAAGPEPKTAAQPASAATPRPPARDADKGTGKDLAKPVCRAEPLNGTRFMHKVCKTQAQWDADHDQAQRLLRQRPGVGTSNAQPGF